MTMQRRHFLLATLGAAANTVSHATPTTPLHWRQRVMLGLGTTLNLRVAHADRAQAEVALDAAVAAIRRVEASMSLYRPDSELVQLNRQGYLDHPSADLLRVLRTAQRVSRQSNGRFDLSVQPLWTLRAKAQNERREPTASEIHAAQLCVGWRHIEVGEQRIELRRSGMALTFNGIAQGYAADAASAALRSHSIANALIDTGEYASLGRNERGQAWALGIEDPHDEKRLVAALCADGRAVATSADNRSAFTADHKHHHIFDPATGDSPPDLSSVTVLASSAMMADALTKVMFVAGPQQIPRLAKRWQVGVLWVDKVGQWEATEDIILVRKIPGEPFHGDLKVKFERSL
ncbi:MAG: FAD:protein FMN transferase [Giesbergeria sp.]